MIVRNRGALASRQIQMAMQLTQGLFLLRRGNHDSRAWLPALPPVRVRQEGVEIDRIACFKDVVVSSNMHLERSAQHRQEFDACVIVKASLSPRQRMEIRVIGVQLALHGGEIERFKVK